MDNNVKHSKKLKYMNEFPIIILVAVVAVVMILIIMYFNIKPYSTIYKNGYMVLYDNMTSNLINNKLDEDFEKLDVGVVYVEVGDYIYKQADIYYVGVEKKEKIDYDYPLYSPDGLTVYNLNENITLIDRKFDKTKGYTGLSLSYGILYNEGDDEQADELDYLFLNLNNSIYVNTQTMVIKTMMNEYVVPMNSTVHFDSEYINYYIFDGKEFKYNSITDISYDSLVKMGDVTLNYDEFMLKMELIELEGLEDEDNEVDTEEDIIVEEIENPKEEIKYVKPTVTVSEFSSNVYSVFSKLFVSDPSGAITSNPMFEIYKSDGTLYSRKRFVKFGDIKISGLSSNTEYRIVGTYKYKNESGMELVSTFYEGTVKTKDISTLEAIELTSVLGDRYPNMIEIKDVQILNFESETVTGVKKVVLSVTDEETNETKDVNLSYLQMSELIRGNKTTIFTKSNLESNTVYNYLIKFYDISENELECSGMCRGSIKTTKRVPEIKFTSNIDSKSNKVSGINVDIKLETNNPDDVYIQDYEYNLYSYSERLISSGKLDYENGSSIELNFDDLEYEMNYIIRITGKYDLEDGKGEQELLIEKDFTTAGLNFTARYDTKTLEVSENSISADIYISSKTTVLEKPNTEVIVCLADENGNDILDENGELKYYNKFTKEQYTADFNLEYHIAAKFDGLESNTNYIIKVKMNVIQLEKTITLEKKLMPSINTKYEDAFVEVNEGTLIADNLNLDFEIIDEDNLIEEKKVIVEIYKGEYDNPENIRERYVYRNVFDLSDSGRINLSLTDFIEESYTIVVSAKPYNESNLLKYLSVNNPHSDDKVIKVNRDLSAKLEMYEQRYKNNKQNTKVSFELIGNATNIYFVDCVDEVCTNLGYLNSQYKFNANGSTDEQILENPDNPQRHLFSFFNEKDGKQHTIYLLVKKSNFQSVGNRVNIDDFYVLASLEYNTGYEIYNINDASDFSRTIKATGTDDYIISTSGDTKRYVVTKDIDLLNLNRRFSGFNGVIDFQGYSVELYITSNSTSHVFSSIGSNGVLKNIVLNYHLNYDGVITSSPGFVNTNSGTIENIIVTATQQNSIGRANKLGLLAYTNSGTIKNFVIKLNTDIHTYSTSSLAVYTNSGTIKNGYITSKNPNSWNDNDSIEISLHDTSASHGTVVMTNSGTVEYVYNLVSVKSAENSYSGSGIATIVRNNTGTTKNTISVATTTQLSNKYGPNIYTGNGNVSNNYYIDTNTSNPTYASKSSRKITTSALMNKSVWEIVVNNDQAFSITSGYYPILKMNDFMQGNQDMVAIPFDYYTQKTIDILSSEATEDEFGNPQAKFYISNPNKLEITDIIVEGLRTSISKTSYDEELQSSVVIIDLYLTDESGNQDDNYYAKSSYNISEVYYKDFAGGQQTLLYNNNNMRTLYIELYRNVGTYGNFIKYLNRNENIRLINNIEFTSGLPSKTTYSAILDGNEHVIDLKSVSIDRGYYFYGVTGVMKNFQVKNIKLQTTSSANSGFIREASNADINNIDLTDYEIEIKSASESYPYIGGLIAYSNTNTVIEKVSINNLTIKKSTDGYSGSNKTNYIGGIVGYLNSSQIMNSYVYNLDINVDMDIEYGKKAIGGIVGYSYSSDITRCYSTGFIETDFDIVGGIAGKSYYSPITDNYSYMDIINSNSYAGGIVGFLDTGWVNTDSVKRNMFIGKIVNKYEKKDYSVIIPASRSYASQIQNNYALYTLPQDVDFNTINIINPDGGLYLDLTQFDKTDGAISFHDEPDKEDLPYLIEASFVEQQIKGEKFKDLRNDNSGISIEYRYDNDIVSDEIIDFYNGKNLSTQPELYNNASADYAIITLEEGYELVSDNAGDYSTNDLSIEELEGENYKYKITPKNYFSSYKLNVKNSETLEEHVVEIDAKFYKKISSQDDWNEIPTGDPQNIILTSKLSFDADVSKTKKIGNLLGNGYTIEFKENSTFKESLIDKLFMTMRDVAFIGFNIQGGTHASLIKNNNGKIENCHFSNMKITSTATDSKAGIISVSYGYINNVKIDDIEVMANNYVGALVAYSSGDRAGYVLITNVIAEKIKVEGITGIGGVVGYVEYTMKNIYVSNVSVSSVSGSSSLSSYIGGIVGAGDCANNCSITNSTISATGKYIGGIGGYMQRNQTFSNIQVRNVLISNASEIQITYLGGIYSNARMYSGIEVEGVTFANEKDGLYSALNAKFVGGLSGFNFYTGQKNRVFDSVISGSSNVGGLAGQTTSATDKIEGNLIEKTEIKATGDCVGGLVGDYIQVTSGTQSIKGNMVLSSKISGENDVGGIIGRLNNGNTYSQNIGFSNNLAIDVSVGATSNPGGLIGYLSQVPASVDKKFQNSLFYSSIENSGIPLVGRIENKITGATLGYGTNELSEDAFAELSNFKEYVKDITKESIQISSLVELQTLIPATTVFNYEDDKHFPIFDSGYPSVKNKVQLPGTGAENISLSMSLLSSSKMLRNYANSYNNKLTMDYDIYASGVNTVNIEFDSIDTNIYFYYEIGDYKSNYIPVELRTYTITYDFKNPIKFYLTNGYNYKESTVKPSELAKTISIIDNETYYIQGKVLYSSAKAINGSFVNLYGNEVLTVDGKIYNLSNGNESDSNITYNILENSKPLYEFEYNGNKIDTYYNYSLANGIVKEMQLFLKNGKLSSISPSLENKKDMYIVDYYNSNEIQIVLKEDGKLYSLKNNIKYPEDIINNEIVELYTNIKSSSNNVVLKYTNGAVYSFDYRTGAILFTNVSNKYSSFLEFAKDKIGDSSKNNIIENISEQEKYKEMDILKGKITEISLEQAKDKLYGSNNATGKEEQYISVYNELTKNYDLYKVSSLLDNSSEVQSETEKLYQNYELVKFYTNFGNGKKQLSLSGILLFAISIVSVLVALCLLIKHKLVKKSGAV